MLDGGSGVAIPPGGDPRGGHRSASALPSVRPPVSTETLTSVGPGVRVPCRSGAESYARALRRTWVPIKTPTQQALLRSSAWGTRGQLCAAMCASETGQPDTSPRGRGRVPRLGNLICADVSPGRRRPIAGLLASQSPDPEPTPGIYIPVAAETSPNHGYPAGRKFSSRHASYMSERELRDSLGRPTRLDPLRSQRATGSARLSAFPRLPQRRNRATRARRHHMARCPIHRSSC